ncbi:hypothetical protein EJ04DRAFT_572427 [Polyplosphaeria fusca]|uniref:PLD phosphodiesterase domain-containing protein n=1 Tax=Polyplosphaeria fusca TaxID=682080 RepID=A0A9P4R8M6_9PLEO|nr:hypothetical protein EJ04DRAFT_572427 [Polyplosphaeria fusca]
MASLLDLQARLRGIDEKFQTAELDTKLEGLAFELTKNESLGLNDKKAFNVNIPFRTWPPDVKTGDDLPKGKYPSALQEAFKDVLAAGSKLQNGDWDTTECWIDIVSLNPADWFFSENSFKSPYVPLDKLDSVAKAIADVVNSIPNESNVTPIVRILAGADENLSASEYWGKFGYRFQRMFWVQEKEGGDMVPLITNEKAKLFVGSVEATSWLETLGASVESVAQQNEETIKTYAPNFDAKQLHLSKSIKDFVSQDLPAISWNHGKLLVVNGKAVMTGGGNYWNEYMGDKYDIVDHQVKVKGDAAVTGHKYTNYFFNYLNKLADNKTDTRSLLRSCTLSNKKGPKWVDNAPAPLADFKHTNTGDFSVLTVGRIGDWHGTMAKVPFPVQVCDAVRDIALNSLWHILPDNEQGKTLAKVDWAFRDDDEATNFSKIDILKIFADLQVNPAAWASRYARKYFLENATNRVCISQQMLVDTLQLDDKSYQDAIFGIHGKPPKKDTEGLNDRLKSVTKGSKPWDGAIWPYDLLCAIGWSLSRIAAREGDGVYIVLTTDFPPNGKKVKNKHGEEVFKEAKHKTWEDKTSVAEFKKRLAICMKGMSQLSKPIWKGGIGWFSSMCDEDRVDEIIRTKLHVKRIGSNDGEHYCHNKIVMVDDQLLYVGSDNAYPSYNEEHGVWIDHKETIEEWKKNYWDGLWAWSTDATD